MLNLRYENQIEFQFDIRDSALDCRIPSMIMQPLIENAVVHGVGEYIKTGRRKPFIRICADHTDNILKINIYDNGKGIPEEQRMSMENGIFKEDGHIGFQNVAKRLRLYYGDRLEIHIRSELDKFTDIRICINLDN